MKTLNNAVKLITTYDKTCNNNSSMVAVKAINEAARLETKYPTREFVGNDQRAIAVFEALMQGASSGAYQVFKTTGPIKTVTLFSIADTMNGQRKLRVRCVFGKVVVSSTLPSGHVKHSHGYNALVRELMEFVALDACVKTFETHVSED